jgi:phytoene dehydrogenase-like protein
VVVGAGLAGLNAAAVLRKRGLAPVILEAGDAVGGRTRTDIVDGFQLDRGFQIFLTGYPEARETLDFEALQLQPFYAGRQVCQSCKPGASLVGRSCCMHVRVCHSQWFRNGSSW